MIVGLKEAIERELSSCNRQIASEALEVAKHKATYECLQDRACMLREFLKCFDVQEGAEQ